MSIKYTVEIDDMYRFPAWSGGKTTLDRVIAEGKCGELTSYLEHEVFACELDSEMEIKDVDINDYLWFERDAIYKALGITD